LKIVEGKRKATIGKLTQENLDKQFNANGNLSKFNLDDIETESVMTTVNISRNVSPRN